MNLGLTLLVFGIGALVWIFKYLTVLTEFTTKGGRYHNYSYAQRAVIAVLASWGLVSMGVGMIAARFFG